jgi:hypothetical protein
LVPINGSKFSPMSHLFDLRPGVLRLSKKLIHKEHLVSVSTLIEHVFFNKELSEDASYRPDINFLIVVLISKDEFWSSIGKSYYILCEVFVMSLKESSKTKIGNFKQAIICDEKVCCLEVSMDDVVLVKEVDSFEHLVKETLDLRDGKSVVSPYMPQIKIHILHNNES